ncbi:transposase [Deinococcus detaillensis]
MVQRWCPGQQLVVVADGTYAMIAWLHNLQQRRPITVITRLRLNAALYEPAPERAVGQMGRPWLKGNRLPTLASTVQASGTCWQRVRLTHWYEQGQGGRLKSFPRLPFGITQAFHLSLCAGC